MDMTDTYEYDKKLQTTQLMINIQNTQIKSSIVRRVTVLASEKPLERLKRILREEHVGSDLFFPFLLHDISQILRFHHT